jgi:serine O-acetyltransferase
VNLSLPINELAGYIGRQLDSLFPDGEGSRLTDMLPVVELALDKVNWCFKHCTLPRYCRNGEACFDHLMADHHCQFVLSLSQCVWKERADDRLASKLFGLNRAMHGLNCMYDTALPDIFLLFHATGTVLGKASYDDYLVVLQNCTVGVHDGSYPVLGRGVALAAGASVVGRCRIGDRVSVGSNAAIFKRDVPSDTVAYRNEGGALVLQPTQTPFAQRFFNVPIESK